MHKPMVILVPQEDGKLLVQLQQGSESVVKSIYTLPAKSECKTRDIIRAMQLLVDSITTTITDNSMTWLDES